MFMFNKVCSLSGDKLYFGRIKSRLETNASIDRIDSLLGYSIDNIQIVTKNINIMKAALTQEEFIRIIKLKVFW